MINPYLSFRSQAESQPSEACFVSNQISLTYAEMLDVVQRASSWLVAKGVLCGQRIAIRTPDEFHSILTLAGLQLGCTTASFVNSEVFERDGFDHLVCFDDPSFDVPKQIGIQNHWLAELVSISPRQEVAEFDSDESLVRIVYSSGTTGLPKGVPFSVGSLQSRLDAAGRNWMGTQPFMALLGLMTVSGIQTFYSQVFSGKTYFNPGNGVINANLVFNNSVRSIKASPAQLRALLEACRLTSESLKTLELIQAAGSFLPDSLARELQEQFGAEIVNLYGSTETGTVAVRTALGESQNEMGTLVPEATVEIVDESNNLLEAGQTGIVRVKTPNMADNYVSGSNDLGTGFIDGWFYPGDVGYLTEDATLFVTGRHKDLVNIGGLKFNLSYLDQQVLNDQEITDACVVELTDEAGFSYLGVAAVSNLDDPGTSVLKSLRTVVHSEVKITVHKVAEIPRNQNGKALRLEVQELIGKK